MTRRLHRFHPCRSITCQMGPRHETVSQCINTICGMQHKKGPHDPCPGMQNPPIKRKRESRVVFVPVGKGRNCNSADQCVPTCIQYSLTRQWSFEYCTGFRPSATIHAMALSGTGSTGVIWSMLVHVSRRQGHPLLVPFSLHTSTPVIL